MVKSPEYRRDFGEFLRGQNSRFCAVFLFSRGETIITQKENKGEYGGINCLSNSCMTSTTWQWKSNYDYDIYTHVFDQNGPNGGNEIPYRYSTNISDWSATEKRYWERPDVIPRCTTMSLEENQKGHKNLYSGTTIPSTSKACVANTHNAGNWYNFPAATASSDTHLATPDNKINTSNSICPKGWKLPPVSGNKSYDNLISSVYNISPAPSDFTSDSKILVAPLSFVLLGDYDKRYDSLSNRGYMGNYWTSTAYSSSNSYSWSFAFTIRFAPQFNDPRTFGFSIRCVSR